MTHTSTYQFCSALLILCIMLDSKRVLLTVKCSCNPKILLQFYSLLIIYVHNNNNNTNRSKVRQSAAEVFMIK